MRGDVPNYYSFLFVFSPLHLYNLAFMLLHLGHCSLDEYVSFLTFRGTQTYRCGRIENYSCQTFEGFILMVRIVTCEYIWDVCVYVVLRGIAQILTMLLCAPFFRTGHHLLGCWARACWEIQRLGQGCFGEVAREAALTSSHGTP